MALRIRKSSLKNQDIFLLNPLSVNLNFDTKKHIVPKNGNISLYLSSILKACVDISDVKIPLAVENMLKRKRVTEA